MPSRLRARPGAACMLVFVLSCAGPTSQETNEGDRETMSDPSSPRRVGDEAEPGVGRSVVELGHMARVEMKPPISHLYVEQDDGTAKVFLSYSVVYSSGAVLSLELPYEGIETELRPAEGQVSGGLVLEEPGKKPIGSTRGIFHVVPTSDGVEIQISDLVMTEGYMSSRTESYGEGLISGEVERICHVLVPDTSGLQSSSGVSPANHARDLEWTSSFCSKYRH